jgi:hypothetical protein
VTKLLLLLVLVVNALGAQTTEKPNARLTLIVALLQPNSHTPGKAVFRYLEVVETNVSFEAIWEEGCLENRGVYGISILYNGVPLKERDAAARKKREANPAPCMVPVPDIIQPFESRTRDLYFSWDYPMCKSGIYEITVSRQSDLEHPGKSVTIKSNTITVVVPKSDACDQ